LVLSGLRMEAQPAVDDLPDTVFYLNDEEGS